MDKTLKYEITIETRTQEEKMEMGTKIHEQLVGNQDYIDCAIILNINEENLVRLLIFEECESIPSIVFF